MEATIHQEHKGITPQNKHRQLMTRFTHLLRPNQKGNKVSIVLNLHKELDETVYAYAKPCALHHLCAMRTLSDVNSFYCSDRIQRKALTVAESKQQHPTFLLSHYISKPRMFTFYR